MTPELLKPQFQAQEIAEVFVEYDGPRIYSFYTPNRGFYLAYNVEDDANHSEWLYVATNSFRIFQLLAQEVCIRKFITEADACYIVRVNDKNQVENVQLGCDEAKLPAEGVLLSPDSDYMTFALSGSKISPFSISENEFTNILTNIRAGTVKAMKTLQGFLPDKYSSPSNQIFGAPMCAPGSLKMLVKIESDHELLKDMLAVTADGDGQQTALLGLAQNQVEEVKNNFYSIAPPVRSRGNSAYDSISIRSSRLISGSNEIVLGQDHKRMYLDYTKAIQASDDVVTFQGTVMRAAKDKCSFTLQRLQENTTSLSEVECILEPDNSEVFDSLTASLENLRDCDSPQDLVSKLLDLECKLKVGGILKSGNILLLRSAMVVD